MAESSDCGSSASALDLNPCSVSSVKLVTC